MPRALPPPGAFLSPLQFNPPHSASRRTTAGPMAAAFVRTWRDGAAGEKGRSLSDVRSGARSASERQRPHLRSGDGAEDLSAERFSEMARIHLWRQMDGAALVHGRATRRILLAQGASEKTDLFVRRLTHGLAHVWSTRITGSSKRGHCDAQHNETGRSLP